MTAKVSRTAIVTGAASEVGIGAAAAARLAETGVDVVLMDRDPSVHNTAKRLADQHPHRRVMGATVDITDEVSVATAIRAAAEQLGHLQILVHSAGVAGAEVDLVDLSTADFDHIINTNLRGSFLVAQAAGRLMKASRRGSIVLVSSVFGLQPVIKTAAYAASKAGVIALGKGLALELGEYGIRVNTIAPGYISTEMLEDKQRERAQRMGTDLDGERRRVEQTIPLRRHGSSHDVADAVAYLTSDQASYVTGWTLGVAGGVVLH